MDEKFKALVHAIDVLNDYMWADNTNNILDDDTIRNAQKLSVICYYYSSNYGNNELTNIYEYYYKRLVNRNEVDEILNILKKNMELFQNKMFVVCKDMDKNPFYVIYHYCRTYRRFLLMALGMKPDEDYELNLPDKLNTDRAKKYFKRALNAGYIIKTETGYESKFKTKALLAYFLKRVFCKDESGADSHNDFPDKECSILFGLSRLGKDVNQLVNNKSGKPKNNEQVDNLFID